MKKKCIAKKISSKTLLEGKNPTLLGMFHERESQRLRNLDMKFISYPEIKAQYDAIMTEYVKHNHMYLVSSQVPATKYYMLHHCVHKLYSASTKLRVVFDGSAKTSSGPTLFNTSKWGHL